MSFIQFFSCVQFHSLASWNGIFCFLMGLRFWRFYNRTAKEKKRNFDFQPVGRFSPEESSGLVEKVFARILASVGCVRGWEIESNWNFGELFRVFFFANKDCFEEGFRDRSAKATTVQKERGVCEVFRSTLSHALKCDV